jgi:NTP pyrophosphatase (non-canonical NTP hydrolase)
MELAVSFETLVKAVEQWAEERGIFDSSTPKDQALKTVAELGEFADNVLKGRDCRDDIGDIIVTLIMQCKLQGYDIVNCLSQAYSEISSRKGKMINGTFVKESDLND